MNFKERSMYLEDSITRLELSLTNLKVYVYSFLTMATLFSIFMIILLVDNSIARADLVWHNESCKSNPYVVISLDRNMSSGGVYFDTMTLQYPEYYQSTINQLRIHDINWTSEKYYQNETCTPAFLEVKE